MTWYLTQWKAQSEIILALIMQDFIFVLLHELIFHKKDLSLPNMLIWQIL